MVYTWKMEDQLLICFMGKNSGKWVARLFMSNNELI